VTFLAVFALCATVDILWIGWTRSGRLGNATHAAAYSAAIQLVGLSSLLLVVDDHALVAANVLGHAAGSYLGVSFNRRDREEKDRTAAERSNVVPIGKRRGKR